MSYLYCVIICYRFFFLNFISNVLAGEKVEYWREQLKNKPIKYWIRTEIEEIVKEKSVDRKLFYEY